MPRHEVDVSRVESPPMPAVPESNAHLAPVAPAVISEASPTGQPLIPPKAVPYLTVAVAAAVVVHETVHHPTAQLITGILLAVASVLGLASPGLRRKQ